MFRHFIAPLLLLLVAQGLTAGAAEYRYGEAWWLEPREDADTCLLLHFGAPLESAMENALKKSEQQRTEEAELATDAPKSEFDLTEAKPIVIDEAKAAPGIVFDYSLQRRQFKLPKDGPTLSPHCRFGAGLNCAGTAAFVLPNVVFKDGTGAAVDCWIKIGAYPEKPACIWEVLAANAAAKLDKNTPGAQLLLHPDGRIQLKLRHQHGAPYGATPELLKIIEASPGAVLYSRKPVPLNQWFHVLCYNDPPVVQGGGSPMGVFLAIDGVQQASFISEKNNGYNFMGEQLSTWYLGNSRDGTQAFTGMLDEFRVLRRLKQFYPVAPMPWRDADAKRPLHFNRPYFLADGAVFHASLDRGLEYDFHKGDPEAKIEFITKTEAKPEALEVPGVRGKAWAIDPTVGFVRFSLKGMNTTNGVLEFWMRPDNFDNYTGAYNKMPPNWNLSAVRFFGKDKRDGQVKKYLEFHVARARDLAYPAQDFQPGEWRHIALEWGHYDRAFLQGAGWTRYWRAEKDVLEHLQPLYAEFGIPDDVKVVRGQAPRIVIDEVAGYNYTLEPREIVQAMTRSMSELQPIPLFEAHPEYKRSIQELSLELKALCPVGETAGAARVSFTDATGTVLAGPFETPFKDGKALVVVQDGKPVAPGKYRFLFQMTNATGKTVVDEKLDWEYAPEPWLGCTAGIIDTPPPPWTPVEIKGNRVQTRMTAYVLDDNGLPAQIVANGVELLAHPIQLLEDGKPMTAEKFQIAESKPTAAVWTSTFKGQTCDVAARWTCEYDGMTRYELTPIPKGATVAPIRLVIPMHEKLATRFMSHTSGKYNVETAIVDGGDGVWKTSTEHGWWDANAERAKKKEPALKREEYEGYGFWCMADLNDRERGLYWFADHARGWQQSKKIPAQVVERQGGEVRFVCNLVAEPASMKAPCDPIVFGVLPHPARPVPDQYRQLERIDSKTDPLYCGAYSTVFASWPMEPRAGQNMRVFPAPDPENPDKGPSYDYAAKCAANFQVGGLSGFRTMYLSKFWLSCRAGTYDGWEWRGGPTGQATLTKPFVEYLCWEMNEFIRRGVYNAIYLDETYCTPSCNVKAGQAILLPDGTVQPGEQNWSTRELFKRWRNIFHQNGKPPMFLSHLTGSFPYHALVFCDSYLDGEGAPVVTSSSRDFIDAVPLHRMECCQNGNLWGVIPLYMVCIWEGGLERGKGWNPHTQWSWRMARGAMAALAHFENGETYVDQGSDVYQNYWKDILGWGAGDLKTADFIPYWRTEKYLAVEGSPKDVLVSFYKQPGKVLLIASNLSNSPKDIRINLRRDVLGLSEHAAAKPRDSGYPPGKGDDILSKQQMAERNKALDKATTNRDLLNDKPDADDSTELLPSPTAEHLTDPTEVRIEKDILIVPTRAKDFRLIAIE